MRFPQAAKSASLLKSKIGAKIAKFATRQICALFRLGPCGRSSAAGAPGPRRGAGGLVVARPSLKRVVPGSVPPWRAPCFGWPCHGFWLPGVFSWLRRGFLLPAARNRGAASQFASRSAIARFFPLVQFMLQKSTFEAFSCTSRQAAPADDVVRRHADFLQRSNRSAFLRGFAQSRRRSLMSAQLLAFVFPLARNFATGCLPLVPHRSPLAARRPRDGCGFSTFR